MANGQINNGGVPIFTPPPPTFTPPAYSGPVCYFHPGEPAHTECAKCGKPICEDCADAYKVQVGEYDGQSLCYDCCREIVEENISMLTKQKAKIKFRFILTIIGIVLGYIIGYSMAEGSDSTTQFIFGVIGAGIGGVFWFSVKFYFGALWEAIKTGFDEGFFVALFAFLFALVVGVFRCIFETAKKTIQCIIHLKKTSGFIESDTQALQQMKDYMDYTLALNNNRGADIETLLAQDSRLADNSFARIAQQSGEAGAEAAMRSCVATFNEHGEIIRNFSGVA